MERSNTQVAAETHVEVSLMVRRDSSKYRQISNEWAKTFKTKVNMHEIFVVVLIVLPYTLPFFFFRV